MPEYMDAGATPIYRDPSPYPAIETLCPNEKYAALLMEDYAGAGGELTAITQYLYHHLVKDDGEIAPLLEGIAKVEMMHLDLLGQAIVKLGADPSFIAWTGLNVRSGITLCERLHLDLASEYAAITQYEQHIRLIADAKLRALLSRIVLDEQLHVRLFEQAIALTVCT